MRVKQLVYGACAVCLLASFGLSGSAAMAEPNGDNHDLHGRALASFSSDEMNLWQSGKWVHDWHDGHLAWWWAVGDYWYLYQRPTFPYPREVATVAMIGLEPPAAEGVSEAPSWFYCERPAGYSPYVSSCEGTWRQVAVSPSTVAQK